MLQRSASEKQEDFSQIGRQFDSPLCSVVEIFVVDVKLYSLEGMGNRYKC